MQQIATTSEKQTLFIATPVAVGWTRRWRLSAWNLWTIPYNALVVMLAAWVFFESRIWKIRMPAGPVTAPKLPAPWLPTLLALPKKPDELASPTVGR